MKIEPTALEAELIESAFPGNCGVNVLHNAKDDGGGTPDKETFTKLIAGILEANGASGDPDPSGSSDFPEYDGGHPGLLLYSLNQKQTMEAEVLVNTGFKPLTTFVNPKSRNTITLYGYAINQPASPRTREPRTRRVAARARRAR